jgi:hypothetical protein
MNTAAINSIAINGAPGGVTPSIVPRPTDPLQATSTCTGPDPLQATSASNHPDPRRATTTLFRG